MNSRMLMARSSTCTLYGGFFGRFTAGFIVGRVAQTKLWVTVRPRIPPDLVSASSKVQRLADPRTILLDRGDVVMRRIATMSHILSRLYRYAVPIAAILTNALLQ